MAIYTNNLIRIVHPIAINTHNAMGFVFNVCTAPLQCRVSCVLYSSKIMVEKVMHIISEYEERLRMCQHVRRLSFGRRMLRDDGAPNRFFLMYLSCDESMAIQYLTYHHSLFSIHSSCKFIRTILIILRLGLVLFFLITYHNPLHSSYKFILSLITTITLLILTLARLVLLFF